MTLLTATKLNKAYKGRHVVKDLSLKIDNGEVVGLLGPNGAGKTTSFYMLAGLISPDSGSVSLGDNNITHLPLSARAKAGLGYLPQEASIFRKLTTAENIQAVLELQNTLPANEQKDLLNQLLDDFKLTQIRHTLGISLSGGERRRVEIARALAAKPRYMLLDEPFAGVDPIAIFELKSLIKRLKELGIGVLITDHNVRETLSICDRAYIVNHGEVMAEGVPETILQNKDVRVAYLGEHFEW